MKNLVLIASLAVNLFFVGVLVGGQIGGHNAKPGAEPHLPPPIEAGQPERRHEAGWNGTHLFPIRALGRLPEEYREEARATIRGTLPEVRALRKEMSRQRAEIGRLLRQPEMDRDALLAALDKMQQAQLAQQKITSDTMVEVMSALPADIRQELVRGIEAQNQKQRRGIRPGGDKRDVERRRERMDDEHTPPPAPDE